MYATIRSTIYRRRSVFRATFRIVLLRSLPRSSRGYLFPISHIRYLIIALKFS